MRSGLAVHPVRELPPDLYLSVFVEIPPVLDDLTVRIVCAARAEPHELVRHRPFRCDRERHLRQEIHERHHLDGSIGEPRVVGHRQRDTECGFVGVAVGRVPFVRSVAVAEIPQPFNHTAIRIDRRIRERNVIENRGPRRRNRIVGYGRRSFGNRHQLRDFIAQPAAVRHPKSHFVRTAVAEYVLGLWPATCLVKPPVRHPIPRILDDVAIGIQR